MGEFKITEDQKAVLTEALQNDGIEIGKKWNKKRLKAAEEMVKMGWLTYRASSHLSTRWSYFITDKGRVVARQLGLQKQATP